MMNNDARTQYFVNMGSIFTQLQELAKEGILCSLRITPEYSAYFDFKYQNKYLTHTITYATQLYIKHPDLIAAHLAEKARSLKEHHD